MATDKATIRTAREARRYFTTKRRTSTGEDFTTLTDDAPEWARDMCREAHGRDSDGSPAMLPDDWRYQTIREAVDAIAEADDDADLDDVGHDFADDVDPYTGARFAWLASNLIRQGYVDEATEEHGHSQDGVTGDIGLGMMEERAEVFDAVRAYLSELHDGEPLPDDDDPRDPDERDHSAYARPSDQTPRDKYGDGLAYHAAQE